MTGKMSVRHMVGLRRWCWAFRILDLHGNGQWLSGATLRFPKVNSRDDATICIPICTLDQEDWKLLLGRALCA
jgi:hypothetical protein